jgi:hypothetical protein
MDDTMRMLLRDRVAELEAEIERLTRERDAAQREAALLREANTRLTRGLTPSRDGTGGGASADDVGREA